MALLVRVSSPWAGGIDGSRRKSAPSAPSPSTPPTSGKSSGSACRQATTSSSSWWSAAAPIGSLRPAAGRALRSPSHFRPFRWHDGVLLRPAGAAGIASGCRAGTRLVQRFLSRRVLAVEGGLSLRLQHDERGTAQEHVRRSRAKPGAVRIYAGRCAAADACSRPAARREQPRSHAPNLHERSRDLRFLPRRAARTDRRDAAQPLLRFGVSSRRRQRTSGSPAPRAVRGEHDGRGERLDGGRPRRRNPAGSRVDSSTSGCRRQQNSRFVHDLLRREMAEARMFLDRIEKLYASFTDSERHSSVVRRGAGRNRPRCRRARALPALCRGRRPPPHARPDDRARRHARAGCRRPISAPSSSGWSGI